MSIVSSLLEKNVMSHIIDWATFSTFLATKSDEQSIPPNTYQKVNLSTAVVNNNSVYDTTTSRFTAPVDGVYEFNAGFNVSGVPTQRIHQLFAVNGNNGTVTDPSYRGQDNNNDGQRIIGSCFIKLNAGDYVEAKIYTTAPSTTVQSSYGISYFSGSLVAHL